MKNSSPGEVVSLITLLAVLVLLVLLVLSMTGAISLCGRKSVATNLGQSDAVAAGRKRGKAAKKAKKAAAGGASPMQHDQASISLLNMDAPDALVALRSSGRDRALYVLGQSTCPACVACKEFLAANGGGDVAVFVDLMRHGAMMKDGSLPTGVVKSLGRGVPCLVAYSHRAGAVLKVKEGFSPAETTAMIALCKEK